MKVGSETVINIEMTKSEALALNVLLSNATDNDQFEEKIQKVAYELLCAIRNTIGGR